MCTKRAAKFKKSDIRYYYSQSFSQDVNDIQVEGEDEWEPVHVLNGYDHSLAPIITSRDPNKVQMFAWGLIPLDTTSLRQASERNYLFARSGDMYRTESFAKLARNGKRCLIPCTGFYEYRWLDDKGKKKHPYYVWLKNKAIFSLGGLYSVWNDPSTGKSYKTYTICTTEANELMAYVHNHGARMPVILPDAEFEKAWLNPALPATDVMKLCQPIASELMDAHTIQKPTNVPGAETHFEYPELFAKVQAR